MSRAALALALAGLACAPGAAPSSAPPPLAIPFHVIAHRGASAYAPENTLPAFRRARELGVLEVELDVQLTRDDALVLFHDATLDEKTDGSGRVRDHTLAALRRMEIGSWFDRTHPERPRDFAGTRLDALSDVFEAFGAAFRYHLEIKALEPGIPRRLLAEVDRFGLRERVMVTSFSIEQLERVRRLAPDLPLTYLVRGGERAAIDRAAASGYAMLGIRVGRLTPELVAAARERGLRVRAFGIRGDADAERALALRVNGMTTNWPDRLMARVLELLADPRSAPPPGP